MSKSIEGVKLTTYEVARDGTAVCLRFLDHEGAPASLALPTECLSIHHEGAPASLALPTECLSILLMTLPRIIEQALQAKRRDPSQRLVYQLGSWKLEQAADDTLILSLSTPDKFEVSFNLAPSEIERMAAAIPKEEDIGPHATH
ncbi:MAG: hypothetical protein WDO24_25950 [Pseudomonadota bacterium]